MNKLFNNKFLILFLAVLMVIVPFKYAHAGFLSDFIGAFTGFLTIGGSLIMEAIIPVPMSAMGLNSSGGGAFWTASFLADPIASFVGQNTIGLFCLSGFCGGEALGMPVLGIINLTSTCQMSIPLTFYIPSFNSGTVSVLKYDNGKDILTLPAGAQRYRAPNQGEQGYIFSINIDGYQSPFPENYNCSISDSNGMYAKVESGYTWTDGQKHTICASLSTAYERGPIDETHNKIALYRFSWPAPQFQDFLGNLNNQMFGMWFFSTGIGSGYGYGGAFGSKIGTGFANWGRTIGWWPGSYLGAIYSDSQNDGVQPLAILDYSQICNGNVCRVEDSANVPQDSYVFYAAKIIGDYTELILHASILGDDPNNFGVPTQTLVTKPNKFLSTANLGSGSFATLPSLFRDGYDVGNVYRGAYKTETVPDNCGVAEKPTNLAVACNTSGNQATLSWSPAVGAAKYNLLVQGNTISDYASTSYVASVTPGTAYTWKIQGFNGINNGEWADGPGFTCQPSSSPVSGSQINITPSSLSFTATASSTSQITKNSIIQNGGQGTLNWSAAASVPWITVSPPSGTLTGGGISAPYPDASGNCVLNSNSSPISCGGIQGALCPSGYTCNLDGNYPDAGGTCILGSSDKSGSISPISCGGIQGTLCPNGSTCNYSQSANINVTVNPSSLGVGTHTDTVTISDPNASNSPQKINVSLAINAPETYSCGRCSTQYKYTWANFTATSSVCNASTTPISGTDVNYTKSCSCITGTTTYNPTWDAQCSLAVSTTTPTVDLKVDYSDNPSSVSEPANLVVSWVTTNSNKLSSCSGTGQGWIGVKSVNGGNDSGANLNNIPAGDYTYSITCNKVAGGTISDSVSVNVGTGNSTSLPIPECGTQGQPPCVPQAPCQYATCPAIPVDLQPPFCSFSSTPSKLLPPQDKITLSWSCQRADKCYFGASNLPFGYTSSAVFCSAISGSMVNGFCQVNNQGYTSSKITIKKNIDFTLNCRNSNGNTITTSTVQLAEPNVNEVNPQ